MKITFAQYEHSRIGFPGIKLKWAFDGHKHVAPYLTILGVMHPYSWEHGSEHVFDMARELARFDALIGEQYASNQTVQG